MNLTQTQYWLSVTAFKQLPPDDAREVAFIGRSNAGKSSAMNAITGINNLARTSKTPGRTQAINVFKVEADRYLIDLPGYGYAKVPRALKAQWEKLINRYLQERESLVGLVIIMDIRRPMQDLDLQLLHWASHSQLAVHILLTKADKLKRGPALSTLASVQQQLKTLNIEASVQVFSAPAKTGIDEARAVIDEWLK